MTTTNTNMLIIDSHELIRTGVRAMLRRAPIRIAGEAETGAQAIDQVKKDCPDVVLVDVWLPDSDGIDTMRQIVQHCGEKTRVVVFTVSDSLSHVARSIIAGASDYLLQGCTRRQLLGAVGPADGNRRSSKLFHRVRELMQKRWDRDEATGLTRRETQVLRHVGMGLSNKEIAESLEISVETVKEHVKRILQKLDVSDRTAAAVWAVRNGWVD